MKLFPVALVTLFVLLASFAFTTHPTAPVNTFNAKRPVYADCGNAKGLEKLICLANNFKATLDDKQLAAVQLPYNKSNVVRWSNFPQMAARPARVGVSIGALNPKQRAAADALLAFALADNVPNEGFNEFEGNMAADDYFGINAHKQESFGSTNFFLAFLGEPSMTGLWELQFGGHHYAFANTYNGGQIKGVTPSFRGVEPMSAFTQNGKTYQPVEQERATFEALLTSLSEKDQAAARLSAKFSDVLLGPGRDGQFPTTKQGIKVSELTAKQKALVLSAIKLYVNDLDPVTANIILKKYATALEDTYIAFTGSGSMNKEYDYVRIDGPLVWIEYSAQPSRDFPGTTHPHSVWRDHETDYGGN